MTYFLKSNYEFGSICPFFPETAAKTALCITSEMAAKLILRFQPIPLRLFQEAELPSPYQTPAHR